MQLSDIHKDHYRFSTSVRVRFAETDAQGVVYNGSYFTYLEVGRVEYFRRIGLSFQGSQYDLTLAEASCRYHSPAKFDDILDIYVRVAHVQNTSFVFEYLIQHRDTGRRVATARTVMVVLDRKTKKPVKLPQALRDTIEKMEKNPPSGGT